MAALFSSFLTRSRKPYVAQGILGKSIRGQEILVAGIAGGIGNNNSPEELVLLSIGDARLGMG